MTSILTNAASMSAIATIRTVSQAMGRTQNAISTGLRISEASHNAAYWSIATSMRSDTLAMGVVKDALGLTAGKLDVAYTAMSSAIDTASRIKERLLAAVGNRGGADKIQTEIDLLARQARATAESAAFAGTKWLSTDIEALFEADASKTTISQISSFSRNASGIFTGSIDFDVRSVSLFNTDGGGIFQSDPRSPKTIGGVRYVLPDGGFSTTNLRAGGRATAFFDFSGPVDLSGGGEIRFDLTVDADSPNQGLDLPLTPGRTSQVVIDRALVDSVLPGSNGVISDYNNMISVLSTALSGKGAFAAHVLDVYNHVIPGKYAILSSESSGLDGSAVAIANLTTTGSAGGLHALETYGSRGNAMNLAFSPFKVYQDVEIAFQFEINGSSRSHLITRSLVDTVLGTDDGRIETTADMRKILDALVGQPGLIIEETGSNSLTLRTDPSDRLSGTRSRIGFYGINVNVEPVAAFGIEDIDISSHYDLLPAYLSAVDTMLQRAIDGAATLGALRSRVDLQSEHMTSIMDSMQRGISQLVDANMESEATRLRAQEVQMQLSMQALSIANAQPSYVLQLMRQGTTRVQ